MVHTGESFTSVVLWLPQAIYSESNLAAQEMTQNMREGRIKTSIAKNEPKNPQFPPVTTRNPVQYQYIDVTSAIPPNT